MYIFFKTGISQEHNLGPGMLIKIKFAIIAALFDYNPKLSDAMKADSWEKCVDGVDNLLELLMQHDNVITTGNLIMEENEVVKGLVLLLFTVFRIRSYFYLTRVAQKDRIREPRAQHFNIFVLF